jgi:hypothetical protein
MTYDDLQDAGRGHLSPCASHRDVDDAIEERGGSMAFSFAADGALPSQRVGVERYDGDRGTWRAVEPQDLKPLALGEMRGWFRLVPL